MLKPAGVEMVSRVDLGVSDNIKGAYRKICYMGSQKIKGKTGTLLAIAYQKSGTLSVRVILANV